MPHQPRRNVRLHVSQERNLLSDREKNRLSRSSSRLSQYWRATRWAMTQTMSPGPPASLGIREGAFLWLLLAAAADTQPHACDVGAEFVQLLGMPALNEQRFQSSALIGDRLIFRRCHRWHPDPANGL